MGEETVYKNHKIQAYYVLLMTLNVTVLMFATLAVCVCCKRRKFPKNELLGLEGKVKLKNPDEVVVLGGATTQSESQADLNLSTADSEKRASTAAHRSLPDIPVNDDNGSELYETVAEKQLADEERVHNHKVMSNLKKQSSVSQHSSISQADDSPYSRVKTSPHDYAKVRSTEHPYAQLNAPSTSLAAAAAAPSGASTSNVSAMTVSAAATAATSVGGGASSSQITLNDSVHRSSHHSDSSQNFEDTPPQAEIPAASAIAGMVSASQDLPYMTPPIANHFSGDSQDSSKGYTSISVREPLANILAQQPTKPTQRIPPLSRDVNDSHYATVSDDSDETYAAIEDPTGRSMLNPTSAADIYTSGSETYAQIQPMQSNAMIVSVEINSASPSTLSATSPDGPAATMNGIAAPSEPTGHPMPIAAVVNRSRPNSDHATPIPPPVDSLRAQMHSRQASSSSNNSSSVGNLGSPKPEKRQANSPLPPTPKSSASHGTSTSNLTSGRNSVISVIELGVVGCASLDGSNSTGTEGSSPQKKASNHKSLSPSKDIEGMYAKVIKKNKFSHNSPSSQDNSPIMARKYDLGITPLDSTAAELMDAQKINISGGSAAPVGGSGGAGIVTGGVSKVGNNVIARTRSNSYGSKDHGYETIPADNMRTATGENRKSDCYAHILQKERQQEGAHHSHHQQKGGNTSTCNYSATTQPPSGYEELQQRPLDIAIDKHYETIAGPPQIGRSNDPGYETLEKQKTTTLAGTNSEKKSSDYDPNYEMLHPTSAGGTGLSDDGYAKVVEKKHVDTDSIDGYSKVRGDYGDGDSDTATGYSTIGEVKGATAEAHHNYASISEARQQSPKAATDSESDHYARIAETHVGNLPLSSATTPRTPGDGDGLSPRLQELPIVSPSSITNSSIASSSSILNINNTTASTSTMSSRQTPLSSQYESLTGSETDAYESVSYVHTTTTTTTTTSTTTTTGTNNEHEHPYERLQPDNSDSQLSSSALTTPDEQLTMLITKISNGTTPTTATAANGTKPLQNAAATTPTTTATTTATTIEVSADVVDDYFQV